MITIILDCQHGMLRPSLRLNSETLSERSIHIKRNFLQLKQGDCGVKQMLRASGTSKLSLVLLCQVVTLRICHQHMYLNYGHKVLQHFTHLLAG